MSHPHRVTIRISSLFSIGFFKRKIAARTALMLNSLFKRNNHQQVKDSSSSRNIQINQRNNQSSSKNQNNNSIMLSSSSSSSRPPLVMKTHTLLDDYEVTDKTLGLGINGKVVECFDRKKGQKCALKVCTKIYIASCTLCFRSLIPQVECYLMIITS